MAAATLDTHAVVKQLKAVGFTDDQAEAVSDVIRHSQDRQLTELVTKTYLKAELAEVKADILKWMFGTIGFQTLVIIGAFIALVKVGTHP